MLWGYGLSIASENYMYQQLFWAVIRIKGSFVKYQNMGLCLKVKVKIALFEMLIPSLKLHRNIQITITYSGQFSTVLLLG